MGILTQATPVFGERVTHVHMLGGIRSYHGLQGTALAQATAGTIRVQLLKIAAHVTVSVWRVHVRLASAFARQEVFARAHAQLLAWADPG